MKNMWNESSKNHTTIWLCVCKKIPIALLYYC